MSAMGFIFDAPSFSLMIIFTNLHLLHFSSTTSIKTTPTATTNTTTLTETDTAMTGKLPPVVGMK